jgi:hypothetical protein
MAKLRLIDRLAAFTDDKLLALEGALDLVEGAVEALSDEIGAEIQHRGAGTDQTAVPE